MPKERIDLMLVQRGLAESRSLARALLMEGRVTVDGRRVEKAGALVDPAASLEVAGPARPFASRGGLKMEAALSGFSIDPGGMTALDIGSGTGGFTDCLLKRGARRVFAVDVGKGQLDHRLRTDPRVTAIEGLNARFLEPGDLPGLADLVVMDVSFISARLILPRVPPVMAGRDMVVLVKPQFEVGRALVGKGGIVREPSSWSLAITTVIAGAAECGFAATDLIPSPIAGAAGNREFLLRLRFTPEDRPAARDARRETDLIGRAIKIITAPDQGPGDRA